MSFKFYIAIYDCCFLFLFCFRDEIFSMNFFQDVGGLVANKRRYTIAVY